MLSVEESIASSRDCAPGLALWLSEYWSSVDRSTIDEEAEAIAMAVGASPKRAPTAVSITIHSLQLHVVTAFVLCLQGTGRRRSLFHSCQTCHRTLVCRLPNSEKNELVYVRPRTSPEFILSRRRF